MKRQAWLILLMVLAGWSGCKEPTADLPDARNLLDPPEAAEFLWNTRFLDLGNPAFEACLNQGWTDSRLLSDGTTVAVPFTRTPEVLFLNYNERPRTLAFRCRTTPGKNPRQPVTPYLNGHKLKPKIAIPEFQTFEESVPPEATRPGINILRFWLGAESDGLEFDFVSIGEEEQHETQFEQITMKADRITMAVGGAIATGLRVPHDGTLTVEFGIEGERTWKSKEAKFDIYIEEENRPRVLLYSREVRRNLFTDGIGEANLDLEEYAGRIVRLVLVATPGPQSRVFWRRLRMDGTEPEATPFRSAPLKPSLVVVYMMDALRPDHLEAYGYPERTSPHIREFAREAIVFENAYSASAWTRTSIASILTGLFPFAHLTRSLHDALPDTLPTIQTELKSHGYHTYGFITNGNVGSLFQFDRGFDTYKYFREQKTTEIHVQSDVLIGETTRLLDQGVALPAYFYVHATDPHAPYTPGKEFTDDLPDSCSAEDPKFRTPGRLTHGPGAYSKSEMDCVVALYNRDVRKTDFYFGQFLNFLKSKGWYDNSLIVLVADHGESFQEHGSLEHGKTVYETEIRIPLLVRLPNGEHGGTRIAETVRQVDIFPTILDSAGIPAPPGIHGISLVPLIRGKSGPQLPVYAEQVIVKTNRSKKAYRENEYKLIQNGRYVDPDRYTTFYELYNIQTDPHESLNLSEQQPVMTAYLRARLYELEKKRPEGPVHQRREVELDPETEERLRALGYVDE